MPGTKKEAFLSVLVAILLGVVVIETGIFMFSNGAKGTGFGKQSASKEQAPGWSRYLQSEWNPFQEMVIFRERVNHMIDDMFNRGLTNPAFQSFSEQFAFYEPEVDVAETEKDVIVRCDLPGIEKDKVDVELKNNYITIKGVRTIASEDKESTTGFFRKERRYGSFSKTFLLPAPVDETRAKASYHEGVLIIELPKLSPGAKEEKSTKVAVA